MTWLANHRYRRLLSRIRRESEALRVAEGRASKRYSRRSWNLLVLYRLLKDVIPADRLEAVFWDALADCGFRGEEREQVFRDAIVKAEGCVPNSRIVSE